MDGVVEEDRKNEYFVEVYSCSGNESDGVLTMNHVALGIMVVAASFWEGWRAGRR
jgi:hypothetical protein